MAAVSELAVCEEIEVKRDAHVGKSREGEAFGDQGSVAGYCKFAFSDRDAGLESWT